MGRLIAFAVSVGLLLAACGGGGQGAPETLRPSSDVARADVSQDAPVTAVAAGLNHAGFGLWQTQSIDENLVFSPLSIGHALLMARAAADGDTGSAIDAALRLPEDAHEGWNALDLAIASSADAHDEITVGVADRVWPDVGLQPAQDWIDLLGRFHGAPVEPLDLKRDPDGSRQIINDWVARATNDLIPDLLPEGFIDPRMELVLTDAISFEARWQTVFGKYDAEASSFTLLDGSTKDVTFMRELELSDRRGEGDGFVGAEIPYVGGDFSMLVIVPEEGRFEEIRRRLDQPLLAEIDTSWSTGPFELLIPRWEDASNFDLLPWLTDIGAAPGSYPAIDPDVFLGAAVHGADISVDEQGTVAAAATAMGFMESGPPEPELTVAADQPFLYLVRHRPTGAVLFAGQVTDPTS